MKTLLKIIVFVALVAFALEFTLKGEQGAFGGAFVKMGVVKPSENTTLKDRVESNLNKARENEAKRYEEVEDTAQSGD